MMKTETKDRAKPQTYLEIEAEKVLGTAGYINDGTGKWIHDGTGKWMRSELTNQPQSIGGWYRNE